MHIKRYILLVITLLVAVACSTEDLSLAERPHEGPVKVGFWVSDSQSETRTQINNDGHSVSWSPQDKVALWAKDANGAYIFQYQKFNLWFRAANSYKAYFATDLASPMTEGQYTYYACYPYPQSVNGTVATFSIPSTQDGKAAGGADIMVAQGSGEELKMLITPKDPADEESKGDYLVKDGVNLNMRHLVHALRFYIPQAQWGFGDEVVERIVFTMPADIAGDVTADVASADGGLTMAGNGINTISLNIAEPIGKSSANVSTGVVDYDFACASIMPGTYGGDLTAKVYSKTKAAQVVVPFNNRQMVAGHITPVGLNCSVVTDQYVLRFIWGGNNLGEEINAIYFYDGESQIYAIEDAALFKRQGYHDVDFSFVEDRSAFKALAGKTITVKYDSEHALVSNSFVMPAVNHPGLNEVTLTVPYLFFEDFSEISTFDNDCDVGTGTSSGSAGNKDAVAFTWKNGVTSSWKGSRAGGKEEHAVRMSCRFEGGGVGKATTYATYPGRIDSAPITGLKGPAKVKIVFDYIGGQDSWMMDANKEKGGTYGNPVLAYGYNTSGSVDFDGGDGIPNVLKSGINAETGGVWTSKYNTVIDYIESCPNNTCLSWRVTVNRIGSESSWTGIFGANGNHYIYLDNVKVQIVP